MFVSICQPLVLNYSLITVTQQKRNWQCLRFSSLGIMILKKKEICLQILLSFFVKYLRSNIRHGKKLIFKLETHCKTHQQKSLMKCSGLTLNTPIFFTLFLLFSFIFLLLLSFILLPFFICLFIFPIIWQKTHVTKSVFSKFYVYCFHNLS